MEKEKIIKISNNKILDSLEKNVNKPGFRERNIFKVALEKKSTIVIGLRRIGKTLLLENILHNYVQVSKGKDNNSFLKKIIYLKLDDIAFEGLSEESVKDLQQNIKELVIKNNVDLLLLDEVQSLRSWKTLIKDIKDEKESTLIYATGSDAKQLQGSQETGVGRFATKYFGVLSFKEMQNINKDLALEKYIDFLHFPHYATLEVYDDEVRQAIVEKAFSSTRTKKRILYGILRVISENVGEILNKNKISVKSEVNKTHLESYLSSLTAGQLIFELPHKKLNNNNSKYYPLIPGINRLFTGNKFSDLDENAKGHLFEQFIIIQILASKPSIEGRMDLSYIHENIKDKRSEIDLVYKDIGYEIKYSNDIKKMSEYVQLAEKCGLKELWFIYLGETKDIDWYNIPVKLVNWKDMNYDI